MDVFAPVTTELMLPPLISKSHLFYTYMSQDSPYCLYLLPEIAYVISIERGCPTSAYFPPKNFYYSTGHITNKNVFILSTDGYNNCCIEVNRLDTLKDGYNFNINSRGLTFFHGISYESIITLSDSYELNFWLMGRAASSPYQFTEPVKHSKWTGDFLVVVENSNKVSLIQCSDSIDIVINTKIIPEKYEEVVDSQIIVQKSERKEGIHSIIHLKCYFAILYDDKLVTVRKHVVFKEEQRQEVLQEDLFETPLVGEPVKLIKVSTNPAIVLIVTRITQNDFLFTYTKLDDLTNHVQIRKNIQVFSELSKNQISYFGPSVLVVERSQAITFQLSNENYKAEQIWQDLNILSQDNLQEPMKYAEHLQSLGLQPNVEPKVAMLESLLRCGNYQVICKWLLAKSANTRLYVLSKYKYIIDFACTKFETLRLQIDLPSLHDSFIPSLYSVLSFPSSTVHDFTYSILQL